MGLQCRYSLADTSFMKAMASEAAVQNANDAVQVYGMCRFFRFTSLNSPADPLCPFRWHGIQH